MAKRPKKSKKCVFLQRNEPWSFEYARAGSLLKASKLLKAGLATLWDFSDFSLSGANKSSPPSWLKPGKSSDRLRRQNSSSTSFTFLFQSSCSALAYILPLTCAPKVSTLVTSCFRMFSHESLERPQYFPLSWRLATCHFTGLRNSKRPTMTQALNKNN